MKKAKGPAAVAARIQCLSMLEGNTSRLYYALAEKTGVPLAKALLLSIAKDSSKHSALLKGMSESIEVSSKKAKDCAEDLGVTWRLVDTFYKEVTTREEMSSSELTQLVDKLRALESSVGEEYYVFVQMKNLEFMAKEIGKSYNVKLDGLNDIVGSIIEDEEHHREILSTVKQLLGGGEEKEPKKLPEVKYQTPDLWVRPMPADA